MLELHAENAAEYVVRHNLAQPPMEVVPLAWGVSNAVLFVAPAGGEPFVLKQSRERLRTADPWFSRLDRIWREVQVLKTLGGILPAGLVPGVRFEDRENYLFAMDAAPADHVVWKQLLLEGRADPAIAARLGEILGIVHRETAEREDLRRELADREVFVQLRVDPFYRKIVGSHPEIRSAVESMIDEMFGMSLALVLADFSPKNVLVHSRGLTLVDFETGHYGDPAFDLGFFLSHLLLKTVLHHEQFESFARLTSAFWDSYWPALHALSHATGLEQAELFRRSQSHLAGCMLARIDGTSKVDYLTRLGAADVVREFTRGLFLSPAADWNEVLARLQDACA